MGVLLRFEPKLVEFTARERDAWVAGDRSDCHDYCAGISGGVGIGGFGEYVVGKHWERQGYKWIHHDFDIFGGNVDHKYPSQEILEEAIGRDRLAAFKALCKGLHAFREQGHAALVQADLMIYSPDMKEVRFAECKRYGTSDRVSPQQALGLFLIASQLRVPAEIFVVAEEGMCMKSLQPVAFDYSPDGVKASG
jgi:hypothetical protein